jgi:hypothetical protein
MRLNGYLVLGQRGCFSFLVIYVFQEYWNGDCEIVGYMMHKCFVDVYYKMKEQFEALKHSKVQNLSSCLDDQICYKSFAMWSLEKYVKDSYDLHVFDPKFFSPHESLVFPESLVFHEDDETVEDLGEAPCDSIEDHAHEEQDGDKGTQASNGPFENQAHEEEEGLVSMLSSPISEVYDKNFDDFEMDKVVENPSKIEKIFNVIVPHVKRKMSAKRRLTL